VPEFGSKQLSFVELRTLMVATDWADEQAMGELAIAGHVSAYGYLMRIVIHLDIGDNMQFAVFVE